MFVVAIFNQDHQTWSLAELNQSELICFLELHWKQEQINNFITDEFRVGWTDITSGVKVL